MKIVKIALFAILISQVIPVVPGIIASSKGLGFDLGYIVGLFVDFVLAIFLFIVLLMPLIVNWIFEFYTKKKIDEKNKKHN